MINQVDNTNTLTKQCLTKNAQIAKSIQATRKRRKQQTCKVIELKIDHGALTSLQTAALRTLFLEAKWIYNDALGSNDPWNYVPGKSVMVKTRDGEYEQRDITHVGSQVKQSIVTQIRSSMKSLAALKAKGHKVGKLQFRRHINAVDLKQHGSTYKLDRQRNRVKIQKIPGYIHVHGMEQFDDTMEFANAKLVCKASGYYLYVTVFINNDDVVDE